MPRKERDSFDALADVMRASPDDVLKAAEILRQHRETYVMGVMLRSAVEATRAPRRKAGRPRRGVASVDLSVALRNAADRRRIDEVADAIVRKRRSTSEVEAAMGRAAGRFPTKRSRPVARAAMERFHARLEEIEADRRKRARDDRPRLYAARVVLEARGEPATAEDGRRLLRRLQRGNVVREAKLAGSLGIKHVREEAGAGLLAKLDEARLRKSLP